MVYNTNKIKSLEKERWKQALVTLPSATTEGSKNRNVIKQLVADAEEKYKRIFIIIDLQKNGRVLRTLIKETKRRTITVPVDLELSLEDRAFQYEHQYGYQFGYQSEFQPQYPSNQSAPRNESVSSLQNLDSNESVTNDSDIISDMYDDIE
ncbi:unnamed protein product [Parnassius apollo]|uniref:(apollo) hypothetical protein n=1 Tax=Parnassius apollo TaxID=110799 RepID=A0A8S3WP51_PARAO|nr:unnamed protein product [Parnassius apollo]